MTVRYILSSLLSLIRIHSSSCVRKRERRSPSRNRPKLIDHHERPSPAGERVCGSRAHRCRRWDFQILSSLSFSLAWFYRIHTFFRLFSTRSLRTNLTSQLAGWPSMPLSFGTVYNYIYLHSHRYMPTFISAGLTHVQAYKLQVKIDREILPFSSQRELPGSAHPRLASPGTSLLQQQHRDISHSFAHCNITHARTVPI